jgi:hypothetical protein
MAGYRVNFAFYAGNYVTTDNVFSEMIVAFVLVKHVSEY